MIFTKLLFLAKKLNVNINSSIADQGFISIYDLDGKLIKEKGITIKTGDNNYTVDINNISSDIYKVQVSGVSFNTNKRIFLE
jgi:type IX secretion system substrate protein